MFGIRSLVVSVAALVTAVVLAPAPGYAASSAAGTGGTIEGTLTSAKGAPVAGIRVLVHSPTSTNDQFPVVVTDASGHYALTPLPAGRYRIGFHFPETLSTQWVPQAAAERGATWFTVSDGETTVVNESLFPTGGMDVTLLRRAGDGLVPAFCVDAIGDLYLKTGCTTTGVLQLTDLPVGLYILMVTAADAQSLDTEWADVTEDATTAVAVQQL